MNEKINNVEELGTLIVRSSLGYVATCLVLEIVILTVFFRKWRKFHISSVISSPILSGAS